MKGLVGVAVTVFITAGAATWLASGETALTGSLPQLAKYYDVHAGPSSIPFVALLVFASLVLFVGLSITATPHEASASPIRLRESGLRRAQRELGTTLLHARRRSGAVRVGSSTAWVN